MAARYPLVLNGSQIQELQTGDTINLTSPLSPALGGTGVTTSTGTGSVVLSTSPTLVTPILGTPTSVTLTNATGLPLTTGVTGTLPVANGGTGLTSFTSGGVVYASSTSALATGSGITYNGTTFSTTNDASIHGLTVGLGAGAVSTNTAVGASALNANTTGANNTAVGYQAGYSNTSNQNTFVGSGAGYLAAGLNNVGVGYRIMYSGAGATGGQNTAIGNYALYVNDVGASNTALGYQTLFSNTTASSNTAVGYQALYSNTTAIENTAVGYQALYSQTTASTGQNIALGLQAGYTTNGYYNTFIGYKSGLPSTGNQNTFIGHGSGSAMTSGSKNTILGLYNGNQGGLDIRTASNKVVLSDGDGNPVFAYGAYPNGAGVFSLNVGYATLGLGGTGSTGTGALYLNGEAASNFGPVLVGFANGSVQWSAGSNSWIKGGTTYSTYTITAGGYTGGVSLTSGATAWTSASDERLKDIIEPITDAATKVSTLRAVIGKYKTDEEGVRRPFLIAQDVQAVLPEAVTEGRNSKEDETAYLQVAYTEVIPLLVAAIKEQQAIITSQAADIAALKAKVGI